MASGSLGLSGSGNLDKTAFGELAVQQSVAEVLIHFPYNLNTDHVNTTVTGSGAVTHSGQFAVMASGAAINSSGQLNSNRALEYNPGIGGLARFTTIFGTPTTGNTQISGIGSATDGFFFGYNETSFGVLHRVNSVDTWIPQSVWNTDKMDGTGPSGMILDPTKGNVFQIRYQWLGFGAIRFYIENQFTGTLNQVHVIDYANQNTTVSVNNPSFNFCAKSENTTNDTDIQMKVPSIGLFIEGTRGSVGFTRNAIGNEKSISAGVETNILTIRNKTVYQGIVNEIQVQPDILSFAGDGAKNIIFRLKVDATLGGTPSYTDIRTNNSVVDFDTAGTTVTGGVLVLTIPVAKTGQLTISLPLLNQVMTPGRTLTISAESTGSNDVQAGMSWQERFS